MPKFSKRYFGLFVIAAMIVASELEAVQVADLKLLDVFRTSHRPHPDIVILAIDQKSLQRIGRWPWDRKIDAALLENLASFQPRAVALDVNFPEPQDTANDAALAQRIATAPYPVVLPVEAIYRKDTAEPYRWLLPLREFFSPTNVRLGHVNIVPAADGLARNFPRAISIYSATYESLGATLARLIGARRLPERDYAINFAGPGGTFTTYSASDLLDGTISSDVLRDKIVLIGATASDLHDIVPVPGSVMAGVEWHATILDNILLNRPLINLSRGILAAIGALLGIVLLMRFNRLRIRSAILYSIGSIIILPLASFIAWQAGYALPYLTGLSAVLGAFFFNGLYRWYVAEFQKRELKRTVQNYFSPQVLEAILKNPAHLNLGGERREVTIFFSDIRSFTTITENVPPEKLAELLHEYFTEMTEEILATDGVVDKFIGDAIMAFWGAPLEQPDHAQRAVQAALGMLQRLKRLQKTWQERGLPLIDIGIGINTGMATVGNMGSAKRFDYTVIGDSVNAASRLESLNKEYKKHIIIAEATQKRLDDSISSRVLGEVLVKGKNVPIRIFEVLPE